MNLLLQRLGFEQLYCEPVQIVKSLYVKRKYLIVSVVSIESRYLIQRVNCSMRDILVVLSTRTKNDFAAFILQTKLS
jgi:hypothetical protein